MLQMQQFRICNIHRHPVSVNCLYHARIFLCVGGSFAYFARNARCTVITDLFVWYSNTQNDFSSGAAIFSLYTLASPSGRNVNYDKKKPYWGKKCFSCSFYLYRFHTYVFYGFPIIKFCNPAVHYETPCILCRSQLPRCLRRRSVAARLLELWVRIPPWHRRLSVVNVVCCQKEVSATIWSLVQRSFTDCGASLCVI